jgi:hypothetical protein
VRSSATSILFDLAGLGRLFGSKERGFTRRIEQATLRLTDRRVAEPGVSAAKRFRRDARYAAGYQRGVRTGSLEIESAIWHVVDETGFGLDLEAGYRGERSSSVRLVFGWQDDTPTERESAALFVLLDQLGFEAIDDSGPRNAAELLELGPASRLGMEIRFDGSVLEPVGEALAAEGGDALFRRVFLNACHRYYAEPFVTRGRLPASPPIEKTAGEAIARMLAGGPEVRDVLTGSSPFHQVPGFRTVTVTFADGQRASYRVGTQTDPEPLTPYFVGIQKAWRQGEKRLVRDEASIFALAETAATDRTPAGYRALSSAFSQSWYRSSVGSLLWPSSMFSTWLWLALVAAAAPEELARVEGVATLSWRAKLAEGDGAEEASWSGPAYWRLREGLPDLMANANLFPIP